MSQPTHNFRDKNVSAAVFEKEAEGSNGKFTSKSIALQTGYKNKDGDWINRTLTIVENDLNKVIDVLQKAKSAMLTLPLNPNRV